MRNTYRNIKRTFCWYRDLRTADKLFPLIMVGIAIWTLAGY